MEYIKEEGQFEVSVTQASINKSTSGTFSLWLEFTTQDSKTITHNLWLSEKTGKDGINGFERTRRNLINAFGLKQDVSIEVLLDRCDALIGKKCRITTKREEVMINGQKQLNADGSPRKRTIVAFMNPIMQVPNITSGDKAELMAKIRSLGINSPTRPASTPVSNMPF